MPRVRADILPRAAVGSPAYRKSLQQMNSQQGAQAPNGGTPGDMTKSNDFARMRLGSYGKKNPSSLTSLELKPATVEGMELNAVFF